MNQNYGTIERMLETGDGLNKDSLCKGRNNLVKPEFEGLVFSQHPKNTDNNT